MICVGELVSSARSRSRCSASASCYGCSAGTTAVSNVACCLALPLLVLWANLHAAVLVGAGACACCTRFRASSSREPGAERRRAGTRARRRRVRRAASRARWAQSCPATCGRPSRTTTSAASCRSGSPSRSRAHRSSSVAALGACAIAARASIPWRDRLLVWALTLAGFTAIRSEPGRRSPGSSSCPEPSRPCGRSRAAARLRTVAGAFAVIAPACLLLAVVHDVRDGPKTFSRSWPPGAARVVGGRARARAGPPRVRRRALRRLAARQAPAVRGRLAIDSRFETFHPRRSRRSRRSAAIRCASLLDRPARTCTCSTRHPAPTGARPRARAGAGHARALPQRPCRRSPATLAQAARLRAARRRRRSASAAARWAIPPTRPPSGAETKSTSEKTCADGANGNASEIRAAVSESSRGTIPRKITGSDERERQDRRRPQLARERPDQHPEGTDGRARQPRARAPAGAVAAMAGSLRLPAPTPRRRTRPRAGCRGRCSRSRSGSPSRRSARSGLRGRARAVPITFSSRSSAIAPAARSTPTKHSETASA